MVPLLDLKAQYRGIKNEIDTVVHRVLDSGQYVMGAEVAEFESTFAAYCNTAYAVAVNSGTSALHLALLAAGVRPGDEVITVPMTFVATTAAIFYVGAKPVFVDIDPATWTMDVTHLEDVYTPQTKAILPVHLHGLMAKMDEIMEFAEAHKLVVIEDAAQAHGATFKGKPAGGIGHIGCFSFYPGKNLGAYGEGGAVVTNDPKYVETIRVLRDCGQESKYNHTVIGYNYRMDSLQAAILNAKMKHIHNWTDARRSLATIYDEWLSDRVLATPTEPDQCCHVYHVYAVQVHERARVRNELKDQGIITGIHYPTPVHLQVAYGCLGYKAGSFPVSEAVARRFISLPIYPELSQDSVQRVCQTLLEAVGRGRA